MGVKELRIVDAALNVSRRLIVGLPTQINYNVLLNPDDRTS